ncbi:hypothetical protein METBIDRAFT_19111, partial [Metschnikowia bicuspidata var. bicuspidata NRRL YB-4993]
IDRNTIRNTSSEIRLANLTVNQEVYYSIVNCSLINVSGCVSNAGNIHVISLDGEQIWVRMTGEEFENSGIVAINALRSNAISNFCFNLSGSFLNTGNMYFGINGSISGSLPFSVTSVNSWSNTGKMIFHAAHGEKARLRIRRYVADDVTNSISNNGTICLNNTLWPVHTNIEGNGCIAVGMYGQIDLLFSKSTYHISET